jgi:GNAT superfamily N-acetyltransferase
MPAAPTPTTAQATETRIEAATLDDLPQLVDLLVGLFSLEEDFQPNREKQEHGLRLILEQPSRGRIFVLRTDHAIVGMVNLLFTISTAEGGFVIMMEDFIISSQHRRQGYGALLLDHVEKFAKRKGFKRITLLTDKISADSQEFFRDHGFAFSRMIPMRRFFESTESAT